MKYCPQCETEYEDWVEQCADCGVPLVSQLPEQSAQPEQADIELVTVFKASDPPTLAIAKDLLEKSGIKYIIQNEGVQDLFGVGRLGVGYNPIIGPVEILVNKNDEQAAKDILKELA